MKVVDSDVPGVAVGSVREKPLGPKGGTGDRGSGRPATAQVAPVGQGHTQNPRQVSSALAQRAGCRETGHPNLEVQPERGR